MLKKITITPINFLIIITLLIGCSADTDFAQTVLEERDAITEETESTSEEEDSTNEQSTDESNNDNSSDTTNPNANVIHSTDLGWMAGDDISDKLSYFVETAKADDVLFLDHFYTL